MRVSTEFITDHVIYNPAYTYKSQLKTTHFLIILKHACLEVNKFNSFYFEGIIDDIPDGEDMVCDHLVFVIHGIGGACDIKFRPIHEVVDSYRDLTNNLSKKHFQRAHLMEQVSRYVTYQEF